jgi:hypothetical protein
MVRVHPDPPDFQQPAYFGVIGMLAYCVYAAQSPALNYLILENLQTLKSVTLDFIGGLAQLGEHLLCKQGVNGSIPLSSTNFYIDVVRKARN